MSEPEGIADESIGSLAPPVTYVAPLSLSGTTVIQRAGADPNATKATPRRRDGASALGRLGEYDLLEEIARGGMGVVYKAWQRRANRFVALKTILAGRLAGADEIARFNTEAAAAARLDHPGIVPIYDVGEIDGTHFFSMAFIEGTSLSSLVENGPVRGRDAARILKIVADAVQYAHLRGVIHRDLKPSNILLDGENRPRITDFGLAKRSGEESGLTLSGQVLGTPGYMPPEQARGDARLVGPESDVYALGAVLYFLVTGRPPFKAASVWETVMEVLDRDPEPPRTLSPDLDADLETICLRCLQKSPERRYRSAGELADELERYLRGEPIWARRVGPVERFVRWCRRNPRLAAATGAAVMGAVATIIALSLTLMAERSARNTNSRILDMIEFERDGLVERARNAETEADQLRKRLRELEVRTPPVESAGGNSAGPE